MSMLHSHEQTALNPTQVNGAFSKASDASARVINIKTYNIHDILSGDPECPVTIGTLQFLIRSQAALHMAHAKENQGKLKELLKKRGNTLRGFVLYADQIGPVAYAIYYPMIDNKGARVAYCEDFFIVESYRKYGIAKILFHELAQRTMQDNAEYLQWATDARNTPVIGFIENKLGAKHPDVITISATELLENNSTAARNHSALTKSWDSKELVTRPLKAEDVNLPERLGLSPNIIRNTGDLPFKGFVTYEKSKPNAPLAITPGWTHFSTFQLREGLHLEQPVFTVEKDADKKQIVHSIITAAKKYAEASRYAYFRWHISESEPTMHSILTEDLGLHKDSMLGNNASELTVYSLTNGALNKLASTNPDRTIRISTADPIGTGGMRNQIKANAEELSLKRA